MLSSKIKDISLRKKFLKIEKIKKIKNFLFINFLSKKKNPKLIYSLLLLKSKIKGSKTKIKNRCIYTNRNKGVSKYFSLSRISQKDLMQFGIVPGFIKSVW